MKKGLVKFLASVILLAAIFTMVLVKGEYTDISKSAELSDNESWELVLVMITLCPKIMK